MVLGLLNMGTVTGTDVARPAVLSAETSRYELSVGGQGEMKEVRRGKVAKRGRWETKGEEGRRERKEGGR